MLRHGCLQTLSYLALPLALGRSGILQIPVHALSAFPVMQYVLHGSVLQHLEQQRCCSALSAASPLDTFSALQACRASHDAQQTDESHFDTGPEVIPRTPPAYVFRGRQKAGMRRGAVLAGR